MKRVTTKTVQDLAATDYFSRVDSPACIPILPFVKPDDVGVEIGVFKGDSSIWFLDHCRFMYFIDPCVEYAENPDKNYFAEPDAFLFRIQRDLGRAVFIQSTSAIAAPAVPAVDFVFIDGNHTYAYVKQDINLYWPKVKRGGFISGHDYCDGHADVVRAVDEFAKQESLPVEVHQSCWRIVKP